ncbi:SMC-Scp complex subunit ScpB [Actinomyces wuliandei]|uniref:SMC-Scp complex subunit ScpB n=1 Tax=Actinomyces wuliandei TaxID=2057743 RepID=UPI000FD7C14B|nr:SMC-Scp complex subunit ScpB [Actinomyces wuliandei]
MTQAEVRAHVPGDGAGAAALGTPSQVGVRGAVEAVLVVADEPVTTAALAQALDLDEEETRALLEGLAAEYRGEAPGSREHGFVLQQVGEGWRLASGTRYSEVVERFVVGSATARLSQAALETLAVIAYRQPVTRSRIAAVRGVSVDGVVRTLRARRLIEEDGTESSGAALYRTSAEFLEYLGISSLEELPALAPYLPAQEDLADLDDEVTELTSPAGTQEAGRRADR